MRKTLDFNISNLNTFKEKALIWSATFPYVAFLDSNKEFTDEGCYKEYSSHDLVIGVSKGTRIFNKEILSSTIQDWHFGHFSFEAFHEKHKIVSGYSQEDGFSESLFFVPDFVITTKGSKGKIFFLEEMHITEAELELNKLLGSEYQHSSLTSIPYSLQHLSKEKYIEIVKKIKNHIARGDIYETNFCINFFSENTNIDPVSVFLDLIHYSPAPFSAFYKNKDSYVLCASPERFLKKTGTLLISQPIKGTIRRADNPIADDQNRNLLQSNKKERAENIMITDLVRNDLTKVSKINTVKVEDLCGVYSFKHVHQLISTISSQADEKKNLLQIMEATFPMGSMTGAPKLKALKLTIQYEDFNRGLYSGTLGYIDPQGNFDFNVVIRSFLFNAKTFYLSFPAGSAITMESIPEAEYEECLLKVDALRKIFEK